MHQLEQELMVLKTMDHPNIISLHQILHAPSVVYIVMELGNMDLYNYSRGVHFDDVALRQIMLGIVKGVDYLHFQGICHMDIKSENVMVMKDVPTDQLTQEHIKLCDFGLCSVAPSVQDDGAVYHAGIKGTPGYFAPEMALYGDEHTFDCRPADIWSVAVTLLNLCEEVPAEWIQAYDCAMAGDIGMFHKGMQQILKIFHDDDYFEKNSAFDLIRRLLRMDPKERLSASQCLNHGWLDEDTEDDEDSDDEENDYSPGDNMSM
jgi:serine/threonine protein kinase